MTLAEWRTTIKRERRHISKKPYSHNIIRLALVAIHKEFGREEANKAVRDFRLEAKGFNKVDE